MTFPTYLYNAVPYKGSLFAVPVDLATTRAQSNNTGTVTLQGHQSKVVTAQFDWIHTYPGNAVVVNLQSLGTTQPLDKLLMIYVDNTLCSFPLTVLFADTQFTATIPANSAGYYPVITGLPICTVYRASIATSDVKSQSTILFCNFAVPANVSPDFLNSLIYQQISDLASGGRQYVIPALGDKYANLTLQLTGSNSMGAGGQPLPAVAPPFFYVITDIVLQLFQCSATIGQGSQELEITLYDDVAANTLREQFVFVHPDCTQDSYKLQTILEEHGLYLICSELSLYVNIVPGTVSVGLASGFAQLNISYALITPSTSA